MILSRQRMKEHDSNVEDGEYKQAVGLLFY